jgi:hypothetical protein
MLPPDLGAKVRFPPVATDAAPRTNEQNGLRAVDHGTGLFAT